LPVVLAATPQLIVAPSSPSVGAPLSQPGFESVSLETTTLVKEVLCAKNTVRTYGSSRAQTALPLKRKMKTEHPKRWSIEIIYCVFFTNKLFLKLNS